MQRLATRLDEGQGLEGLWLTMSKRHHGHDSAVIGQVSLYHVAVELQQLLIL